MVDDRSLCPSPRIKGRRSIRCELSRSQRPEHRSCSERLAVAELVLDRSGLFLLAGVFISGGVLYLKLHRFAFAAAAAAPPAAPPVAPPVAPPPPPRQSDRHKRPTLRRLGCGCAFCLAAFLAPLKLPFADGIYIVLPHAARACDAVRSRSAVCTGATGCRRC